MERGEGWTSNVEHRTSNVEPRAAAETMGDRIRALREARGMSQETAALEAEISRVTWSRLEMDEIDAPRLATVMRVASVLQVSIGALVPRSPGERETG